MQLSALELASLKQLPIFSRLSVGAFDQIAESLRLETYRNGQVVFRQGEQARALFVIVEGWVKLSRLSPSGAETVIHILTRGQSFGEAAALAGAPLEASAEAVSPALVARVPSAALAQTMAGHPEVPLALLHSAALQTSALMDEIESLKGISVDHKVAHFILSLCPSHAESWRCRLPYGKRLIAARLGIKQETLSRSLARLRALGVETGETSREITIANVPKLRSEASRLTREPVRA
jgi:CRP-like cAMP-binding protein